jgi:flagellar basal body-associated protein FliL
MEFFILIISVPLFLIVVLLISVFVLANYSGNEPAKSAPDEPAKSAPTAVKSPDTSEGADSIAT